MFKTCLCKRFRNRFLLLGFRFTLLVLDFSVPGSLVEIDNMIGAAATILHQDHRNGMLCILPQRYSGQSVQSNITACRRIEDALLTNGISLETDIAMHFVVDAMHGNDRRPLSARARLCFSEKVVGDEASPWLASPFASRGKMADIPLMRIREMKRLCHPGHIGEAVEAYSLSPAERCQQKGSQAVLKIVEALIAETDMASPECRLDIIEMKVNMVMLVWGSFADETTMAKRLDKAQGQLHGFCPRGQASEDSADPSACSADAGVVGISPICWASGTHWRWPYWQAIFVSGRLVWQLASIGGHGGHKVRWGWHIQFEVEWQGLCIQGVRRQQDCSFGFSSYCTFSCRRQRLQPWLDCGCPSGDHHWSLAPSYWQEWVWPRFCVFWLSLYLFMYICFFLCTYMYICINICCI